jgi:hypothetical protein
MERLPDPLLSVCGLSWLVRRTAPIARPEHQPMWDLPSYAGVPVQLYTTIMGLVGDRRPCSSIPIMTKRRSIAGRRKSLLSLSTVARSVSETSEKRCH